MIKLTLNLGTYIHAGQLVGFGVRIDTVGEEYIKHVVLGVDPHHGTGETCVAVALLRGFIAGTSSGAFQKRFVEAECPPTALFLVVSCVKEVNGLSLEIATAIIGATVEQHLQDSGQVVGSTEKSSMPRYTPHGIGILVVHNTLHQLVSVMGVEFGRCDKEAVDSVLCGVKEGVTEPHRRIEMGVDEDV